jgi:hypothetical protein
VLFFFVCYFSYSSIVLHTWLSNSLCSPVVIIVIYTWNPLLSNKTVVQAHAILLWLNYVLVIESLPTILCHHSNLLSVGLLHCKRLIQKLLLMLCCRILILCDASLRLTHWHYHLGMSSRRVGSNYW